LYTKEEFLGYYGPGEGQRLWQAAGRAAAQRSSRVTYYVGQKVKATGRLAGDKGQVVNKGDMGEVTALAGPGVFLEDGAVAEVCINGVTFDAQEDMIVPARGGGGGGYSSPPPREAAREPRRRSPARGGRGEERRADPSQSGGKQYTHQEFIDYYGRSEGNRLWSKSVEKRADPNESSGKKYTFDQFVEFYGKGRAEKLWKAASSAKGKEAAPKGKSEREKGGKSERKERKEPKEKKERDTHEVVKETLTIKKESAEEKVGWIRRKDGLEITKVEEGTPADKAGVEVGMRITQLNGQVIKTDEECMAALKEAGLEFEVVVTKKVLKVKGAKKQKPSPFVEETVKISIPEGTAAGWKVNKVLIVGEVASESPADKAGIVKGSKLLEVAGKKVANEEELTAALGEAGEEVEMLISKWKGEAGEEPPGRFEEVTVKIGIEEGKGLGWTTGERLDVTEVAEDSAAAKAGVAKKWRIHAVNGTRVDTQEALEEALGKAEKEIEVVFTKRRDRPPKAERRKDPGESGSGTYTLAEFIQYHGEEKGKKLWEKAGAAAAAKKAKAAEKAAKKKELSVDAPGDAEEIEAEQGSPGRKVKDYMATGEEEWDEGEETYSPAGSPRAAKGE